MPLEIERKFLPKSDAWRKEKARVHIIRQGYLARSHGVTVRIRLSRAQSHMRATLCVKGTGTPKGVPEYEFPSEVRVAEELLQMCGDRVIEKIRHHITYKGQEFEVDEFQGKLAGNVLIEAELDHVGQVIKLPPWVGEEVTDDRAYTNAKFALSGWPVKQPAIDPTIQTPPMIERS